MNQKEKTFYATYRDTAIIAPPPIVERPLSSLVAKIREDLGLGLLYNKNNDGDDDDKYLTSFYELTRISLEELWADGKIERSDSLHTESTAL